MTEIKATEVFEQLKKQNGEKFAQAIRGDITHDCDLCVIPNIVHILQYAGSDKDEAVQLRKIIMEIYMNHEESQYHTDKDPLELLNEAGYDAFVVKNEEQKNSIKKYYRPGEELCTFRDPTRHQDYYIIHAVKRGADKIKPSDIPQRQDPYGTSVISIQIAKIGGFISIKNRYNHTVNNPDATFDNNPDNIIPGLSDSLKKYFHVDFNVSKSPLPDNYRMVNDQLIRYNYEVNNVYFGSDYYFSGSEITKLNTDYQYMLDHFILDVKNKKIIDPGLSYDNDKECTKDIFDKVFLNGGHIEIKKDKKEKKQIFFVNGVQNVVTKNGRIIELNLPGIETVGLGFCGYNKTIKFISMPDVEEIGNYFLLHNCDLEELSFPKLKHVGDDFCRDNSQIKKIDCPLLKKVGANFLKDNECLKEISLPNLKSVKNSFVYFNEIIEHVNFPNLETVGMDFMSYNEALTEFIAPNLSVIGMNFLRDNKCLSKLQLSPDIEDINNKFLHFNTALTEIDLPNVVKIADGFLSNNNGINEIVLPNVQYIGDDFLRNNMILKSINAPKLKKIGKDFLTGNAGLTELNLPNVLEIGRYSLQNNHNFVSINLPKAEKIGDIPRFQPNLKDFYVPNIPESQINEFAKNNEAIMFSLAKQRIQEKIDKMTEDAKEQIATLFEKNQQQNN